MIYKYIYTASFQLTAFLDRVAVTDHGPCSETLETDSGRNVVRHVVCDLLIAALGCSDVLGVRLAFDVHHAVAHLDVLDVLSYLGNLAGAFEIK